MLKTSGITFKVPALSIVCAGLAPIISVRLLMSWLNSADLIPKIKPGLVQNWPQPKTTESAKSCAIFHHVFKASGNINIGLMLLISANTGIGCGRAAAMSHKARPPRNEPVKPTP